MQAAPLHGHSVFDGECGKFLDNLIDTKNPCFYCFQSPIVEFDNPDTIL